MSGRSENPLKRVIGEIHRRSLWQVLAIYVAASWAVLEVADVLIERLALPDWIYGFAVILLLIGLPVVLATAFVQEGARDSRRERGLADADAGKTISHDEVAEELRNKWILGTAG